jgi:hypothetical protein
MDFEKLSNELYFKASHHKFARKPTEFDRGYMKISDWINDLCWYYMHKKKQLDKDSDTEYKRLVQAQRQKIYELPASSYRDGLLKAMDDLE